MKQDCDTVEESRIDVLQREMEFLKDIAQRGPSEYGEVLSLEQTTEKGTDDELGVCVCDSAIEKIQDPAIQSVLHSICRLQSNYSVLASENDLQSVEICSLRGQLRACQDQLKLSHETIRYLQQRNDKLESKVKRKTRERNYLAKHMKIALKNAKELSKSQRELENLRTVYQLHVHEHQLQQSRSRVGSLDDSVNMDSFSVDDEISSDQSSMSSTSSLFLDDAVASLRIGLDMCPPPQRTESNQATVSSGPSYTLSFPNGTKLGLKLRAYCLEELEDRPEATISKEMLEGMHDNENTVDEHKKGHFNLKFGLDHLWNRKESADGKKKAFLVSGFDGFDRDQNPEPRLGTRIIAINGVEVDTDWSLAELHTRLIRASSEDHGVKSFSVTFREDKLPDKLLKSLENSAGRTEAKDSKQDSQPAFNLGFLKFGQRKRTASTTEQSQDISVDDQQDDTE